MIDRARESRNPKKVIRVTLMESYGEIGRVPVNLLLICYIQHKKMQGDGTCAEGDESFLFCPCCSRVICPNR